MWTLCVLISIYVCHIAEAIPVERLVMPVRPSVCLTLSIYQAAKVRSNIGIK